jgi:predicted membrane protein
MEKQVYFDTKIEAGAKSSATKRKTVMFGLLVITFGVFWLFQRLGMLDQNLGKAVFSWQALVIAIGLINLVNGQARFFGLLLILVGGFFMTMRMNLLPENYQAAFWPAIIIVAGLWIIFSSRKLFYKRVKISTGTDDYFEEISVFSGSERKVVSNQFRGGEAVSVFGGSVIDLTRCQLAPGTNKIEIVSVFGGVKLIVPPDWNIKTEMVNVLGGFSDKRRIDQVNTDKLLVIEGVAIFGGGELTNG